MILWNPFENWEKLREKKKITKIYRSFDGRVEKSNFGKFWLIFGTIFGKINLIFWQLPILQQFSQNSIIHFLKSLENLKNWKITKFIVRLTGERKKENFGQFWKIWVIFGILRPFPRILLKFVKFSLNFHSIWSMSPQRKFQPLFQR